MSSSKPNPNAQPRQQDKDNQPGIHDSQFGQKKPGQQHQQSTPQQQPGQHGQHQQVEQNVDPQRQRPHHQQQK